MLIGLRSLWESGAPPPPVVTVKGAGIGRWFIEQQLKKRGLGEEADEETLIALFDFLDLL